MYVFCKKKNIPCCTQIIIWGVWLTGTLQYEAPTTHCDNSKTNCLCFYKYNTQRETLSSEFFAEKRSMNNFKFWFFFRFFSVGVTNYVVVLKIQLKLQLSALISGTCKSVRWSTKTFSYTYRYWAQQKQIIYVCICKWTNYN